MKRKREREGWVSVGERKRERQEIERKEGIKVGHKRQVESLQLGGARHVAPHFKTKYFFLKKIIQANAANMRQISKNIICT